MTDSPSKMSKKVPMTEARIEFFIKHARSANMTLIKGLVEQKGVDVNCKDNCQRTPLHFAAYGTFLIFFEPHSQKQRGSI